jgi:peptide/nickel transport system permease protein
MMRRLIGKRVLQFIPVLFGVSFLSFLLLNLQSGDTAEMILGENATPQSLALLRSQLHLNQPMLERYFNWLGGLFSGHFGTSLITDQPVIKVIEQRLPVTEEIIVLALVIAIVFAIPMATIAAFKMEGAFDRAIRWISMIGIATPGFVLGIVLILAFTVKLHWFPSTGFVPLSQGLWPNLRTMVLPAITLSAVLFATYTRILRADMAEQLINEDYVQTARAKGVSEQRILIRHVLRNSLFGLVTVIGVNMGTLIAGTVIVESIFALPGVGQDLVSSVTNRDITVVQGLVVLIGVVVVVSNLVADVLYTVIDPRVRYGRV